MFDLLLTDAGSIVTGDKCVGVGRVSQSVPLDNERVMLVTSHGNYIRRRHDVITKVVRL